MTAKYEIVEMGKRFFVKTPDYVIANVNTGLVDHYRSGMIVSSPYKTKKGAESYMKKLN